MGEFGAYKGKEQAPSERVKECVQILLKLSPTGIAAFKFLSAILQCEMWAKSLQMVTPVWFWSQLFLLPWVFPLPSFSPAGLLKFMSQKNKVISSSRTQSKNLITFRLSNHVIVSGGD